MNRTEGLGVGRENQMQIKTETEKEKKITMGYWTEMEQEKVGPE